MAIKNWIPITEGGKRPTPYDLVHLVNDRGIEQMGWWNGKKWVKGFNRTDGPWVAWRAYKRDMVQEKQYWGKKK